MGGVLCEASVQCWTTRSFSPVKLTIDQKFWLAIAVFALVLIAALLALEK